VKKSDWALIILVVGVVAVLSWFIIDMILPPLSGDVEVIIAPRISSDIEMPGNNVVLYDADRPSWCPKVVADDEISADGKQYINSVLNSCAINSSFTTTTE